MRYRHKNRGTCSTEVTFEIEDGKVHNVVFTGGCNGNLKAIGKLSEGRDAAELISLLKGNTCGLKGTSCADQLTKALEQAKAKMTK